MSNNSYSISYKRCSHDEFTYRHIYLNLYLFSIYKTFKVCHNCHEIINDDSKWKLF